MAKKESTTSSSSKSAAKAASKSNKAAKSSTSKPKSKSKPSSTKFTSSKVTKDVAPSKTDKSKASKTEVVPNVGGQDSDQAAKSTEGKGSLKSKAAKTKPKGKIVKSPEVEDLNATALADAKKPKKKELNSKYVDFNKISKALSELKKFIEKSEPKDKDGKSQLFEDELVNNVQIILSKKDLFTSKKSFKPQLIRLEDADAEKLPKRSIALFVRDDLITKEELEKIEESELNGVIGEIIPASELKTTYQQYEKRRELFSQYDLFLSDDALVTTLPKLLGKVFYNSRKIPIPIKISNGKFSIAAVLNQIQNKVLKSIIYQTPRANSLIINLGSIDCLNPTTISTIINHFKDEKQLTAVYLKSNQSPSLPIYECEKVYSKEDVKLAEETKVEKTLNDVELSNFERGLVELADPDAEIQSLLKTKKDRIAKKMEKKKSSKVASGKVTKPSQNSSSKSKVEKKLKEQSKNKKTKKRSEA